MKNYTAFILSIATVIAVGFGFSSCKEDEPPSKPKLSFSESTMTVNEDDGTIEVELVLDKAYSKDLNIEYDLGGTASDQDAVGTADADYEVAGDHGSVVIESGETSGVIELDIYDDSDFEDNETIEISIIDINTSDVELTADDEIEITITNDDAQLQASFASTTMTVNEADGTDGLIEITVQLDQTATQDIVIEYTLDGSAFDSAFAYEEEIPRSYYDYYINGVTGELVIPSGQNSANIEIQLYTDFMFEDDETIEITLTGSNAAPTNNKMTITLEQQDGKVIALVWDETYTNVDMDMFLWVGEDIDNLVGILATALTPRTTPTQELIFIPSLI
ncbi:MAG: Calx-beta domain-containing protein, partial [Cyclobacteriaceae bacterium]